MPYYHTTDNKDIDGSPKAPCHSTAAEQQTSISVRPSLLVPVMGTHGGRDTRSHDTGTGLLCWCPCWARTVVATHGHTTLGPRVLLVPVMGTHGGRDTRPHDTGTGRPVGARVGHGCHPSGCGLLCWCPCWACTAVVFLSAFLHRRGSVCDRF